jgi:acetyl esterase
VDTSLPKLDQALSSLQAALQAAGLGALDPLTTELEQTRSQLRRGFAALSQFPPPMTAHRNVEIPVADYRIRCRIYWPTPARECPALVYVHGGGWFFGDVSTHDRIARELARASTLPVVSVGYSNTPERKYPAQLDEILNVISWLAANGKELGLDSNRLAFVGDSAGANLVLSCVASRLNERARSQVRGLVLYYGVYSGDLSRDSWQRLGDGKFGLSRRVMDWYWSQYLHDLAQKAEPAVSPLNGSLANVPAVWLGVGDLDPLIDDSRELAAHLHAQGKACHLRIFPGYTHGFLRLCERLPGAASAIEEGACAARVMLNATGESHPGERN